MIGPSAVEYERAPTAKDRCTTFSEIGLGCMFRLLNSTIVRVKVDGKGSLTIGPPIYTKVDDPGDLEVVPLSAKITWWDTE
jgi:hypothetical protein